MANAALKPPSPERELKAAIARLEPSCGKLFSAVRAAVRKRLPTANELGYDYGKALVLAYGPNDRGVDAVVAIRGSDTGVALYFNQGPVLPDPKKLLQGSGRATRFIPVEKASEVAHPDVVTLINAARSKSKVPLPASGKGQLIFKSSGKKPAASKGRASATRGKSKR